MSDSGKRRLLLCQVQEIIDGDTFTGLIDLGFGTFRLLPIRIKGINTPEMRGAHHREAVAEAARLAEALKANQMCILRVGSQLYDKYGRLLADVFYCSGYSIMPQLSADYFTETVRDLYIPTADAPIETLDPSEIADV